jgi:hypothetical protein
VLAFVLLSFALLYYFGPDLKKQKFVYITPGAVTGVALWLLVSFSFRLYLHYFDSYSKTYGSLGAVIILMLWFYLTGAAILIGGEINSEIENAMARAGSPEAKEKGEKQPDDRRAIANRAQQRSVGLTKNSATPSPGERQAALPRNRTGRGLSAKKVAVVLGAWALAKLQRSMRK